MTMHVLIICSSFPPVNAAAVYRTVALCRRLAAGKHRLTVLTMPPAPGQAIDPRLAERLPDAIKVLRTPAWSLPRLGIIGRRHDSRPPAPRAASQTGAAEGWLSTCRSWLSGWLSVPDSRIGWLIPAVWSGLRESRQGRPDVIYSTAPMWTAHLVGLCLSRLLGRPWVADCRDPWRANPFRRFAHAAHRRVDTWLEGRMVARAAFVICNTHPARDALALRCPSSAARLVAIPNGYDADEIAAIRRRQGPRADGICRFVHAGTFYGPRSPMPLLAAIGLLARRRPELRSCLRLCQIGPADYDGVSLASPARRVGIADLLELPGRLPHEETLTRVHQASVAVVCGHGGRGCDLQIPRKFYEYVGLGTPTLVTGGACGAVRQLLDGHDCPSLWLADDTPRGARGLCEVIERIVLSWREGTLRRDGHVGLDLSAERMAERIETVLVRAAGRSATPKEVPPCLAREQ